MAIKALACPSSGWERDARKAGRSKRRDLSGVVGRRGVRARIVPHRRVPRGIAPRERGSANPSRGKAGQEDGCGKARRGHDSAVNANCQTRRRSPGLVAGERLRLDGPHAVGTGNGVKGGVWYSLSAKQILRAPRAVHPGRGLAESETVPVRKPSTGEPYAGKPPVRFGGRGGAKAFPTPITVPPPLTRGFRSGWSAGRDRRKEW